MGWLVLCQPHSGIDADGAAPICTGAGYYGRGDKRAGWCVPPEQSQTTSIHIFLCKPNTMVTLGEDIQFHQVIRGGGRPDTSEQAKLWHSFPNQSSNVFIHVSDRMKGFWSGIWGFAMCGVCTWSLKWKDGQRMFSTEFKGQDWTAAEVPVLVSHVCHALRCQSQMSKGPITGGYLLASKPQRTSPI